MRYLILIFLLFPSFAFSEWGSLGAGQVAIDNCAVNVYAAYGPNAKYRTDTVNYVCYVWIPVSTSPCSDGQTWNQSTQTCDVPPCADGSQPDIFGNCPPPLCPQGEYNNPDNGNCIPEPCEGGGFACCDSQTAPDACDNPPPCNELTDPECAPDQDPECGENQVWNGTTCVNQDDPGNSSSDNSSSGSNSSEPDSGGDSSSGGDGDGGSDGGTNTSDTGSASSSAGSGGAGSEGSNNSEGSTYTGSGDCSTPPSCEAGEPDCELLKQQFEQHCKLIEYTSEPLYEGEEGEQESQITEAYNDFKSRIESAPIVNAINTFFSMPASSGGCPTYSVDVWFFTFTFDHWCASWIPWELISGILLAVSIFIAARIALT